VLYAEPNAFDVDLTRRYFYQQAPHIRDDVVGSGEEVLARIPQNPEQPPAYDVLLLDFRLPGLNALEVVKALRQEGEVHIPIVLVTGHGSEEVATQALRLGVDDYLVKHAGYLHQLPAVLEKCKKQAELRQSEARYHSLFDNNHAVMLLINPADGQIVDANPAACAFYGYQAEALRVMKISDINLLSPEQTQQEVASAFTMGRNHFAFRHRLASGEVRDVEVFSGPIEVSGQNLLYSIVHDVTERTRAEEGLHLARFCIDHAAVCIFRIEWNARIVEANDQACKNLGYSREELCTLSVFDIAPDLNQDWWYEHWQGIIRGKSSETVERRHRRKDGSTFPVEVTTNYLEYGGKSFAFSFVKDITERKRYEEQLKHLATHDELTGLANRALLQDRLEQSIHFAHRSGRIVAALLLDLDRFKVINDSLGHAFGDKLLCDVAHRLRQAVREADTVARMGGDEFVILLAEVAEPGDVGLVATKILKLLAEPYHLEKREITVTASLGVSLYPKDSDEGATLIRNADIAMYRAKKSGGNTFSFYAPDMNKRVLDTLELESALRHALDRGEFRLHYQPKINLTNGRVIGCEALVRWCHPQRGMVSPADFSPLAEETGLIVPLGAWVLKEACRQNRAWQAEGLPALRVAVNLSARQFHQGDLPNLIRETLVETGLDPQWLELELTESMVMGDPTQTVSLMAELKRLGVHLALDDFGTGYSSLAYLSRFTIDCLKIDRSFVKGIVADPGSATIATAIIALAHRMRLRVVAEGVETEAQLGYLRKYGCDEMQGFLFSRPLPAEEFSSLIRQGRSLSSATTASPGEERTLLIVDDEPNILSALRRALDNEGYRILTASGAQEGLDLLARHNVQVILADYLMPQMSGTEFLGRVKSLHPDTVRIVLSGFADLDAVTRSVNEGALFKFLGKPWDDDMLRANILEAFNYYDAIIRPRRGTDVV
jgi:diguanylate cyclase (GGDEF)-like protein/PAS domain S-box-containing protein